MVSILSVLQRVPDPRGRQGLLHPLHALPAPMPLSMLRGRRGAMATFRLGLVGDKPHGHLSALRLIYSPEEVGFALYGP